MFSFLGGKSQKPTPQSILGELLRGVALVHGARVSSKSLSQFMKFTKNIDLAGELLLAITTFIDENAEDVSIVFKCMQIIFYCLTKSHETVFPCTQAFAPEILTVSLLSFNNDHNKVRKIIHKMAINIYRHSIVGDSLEPLSSFGLLLTENNKEKQIDPQQTLHSQKMKQHDNGSLIDFGGLDDNVKPQSEDKFGDMISFTQQPEQHIKTPKTDLLPENDRPREPGAFAAFSAGRSIMANPLDRNEEFGSLISFDDVEMDEPEPPKEFVDDDGFVFGGEAEPSVSFAPFTDPATGMTFEPFSKESSAISSGFSPFTSNDEKYFASESSEGESHKKRSQIVDFDDSFGSVQSNDDGEIFDPFASTEISKGAPSSQLSPKSANTDNTFSPFGLSPHSSTASFDPFAPSQPQKKAPMEEEPFDPFASSSMKHQSDTFDPFGSLNNSSDTFDPFKNEAPNAGSLFDPFGQSASRPSTDFDPFPRNEAHSSGPTAHRTMSTTGSIPVLANQSFDPFGEFASSSKGSADSSAGRLADPLSPKRPPGSGFLGSRAPEPPKGINAFDLIEGIEDDVADPLK